MLFALGIEVLGLYKPSSIDEIGQIHVALEPPGHIATYFHGAQNHPLLGILSHYAIRHLPFSVVRSARIPAVVAGLLLAWLFYRGRRRWAGPEAAILAAFLLVFVDPINHYASSARGYALLALGALVSGDLLLAYLERSRPGLLLAYVVTALATCYSHLWAFPVLMAHGVFLASEALRPAAERPAPGRIGSGVAAIGAAGLLGVLAYAPMIPDITEMGSQRGSGLMVRRLIVALLQMMRYGSWTVAVYVVLVPVLLEGLARHEGKPFGDRTVRFHTTVIAVVLAFAAITNPINFGSRFLLGIAPSVFALVAWALAGYWRGTPSCTRLPMQPAAASCLIGFGLGVFVANAPLAHEIPPRTNAELNIDNQGDYYHMLPKEVGNRPAFVLLVAGAAGLVLRRRIPPVPERRARQLTMVAIVFLTLGLIVSIVPLALGPYAFRPRGLFEVHMVAVGLIALLAWQHRFDSRALHALRFTLPAFVLVAALWQAGFLDARFDLPWLARLTLYVPPILVVVALARTTRCPG
jgi:hypothetical protein